MISRQTEISDPVRWNKRMGRRYDSSVYSSNEPQKIEYICMCDRLWEKVHCRAHNDFCI